MAQVNLFIQSMFLEGINNEVKISQEYDIQDGLRLIDLIDDFSKNSAILRFKFLDEQNQLRKHINIFINNENCRKLNGLETVLLDKSEIAIFRAVSGG